MKTSTTVSIISILGLSALVLYLGRSLLVLKVQAPDHKLIESKVKSYVDTILAQTTVDTNSGPALKPVSKHPPLSSTTIPAQPVTKWNAR